MQRLGSLESNMEREKRILKRRVENTKMYHDHKRSVKKCLGRVQENTSLWRTSKVKR